MPAPGRFANRLWREVKTIHPVTYVCGYCSFKVSSEKGYKIIYPGNDASHHGGIYICPQCSAPTFFSPDETRQIPGPTFGNNVSYVPKSLDALYGEARSCIAEGCFTASVQISRKMLMN